MAPLYEDSNTVTEPVTVPGLFNRIGAEVRVFCAPLQGWTALLFILSGILLWFYDYYGSTKFFRTHLRDALDVSGVWGQACSYFYWFGSAVTILMVIPLIVIALHPREKIRNYGLGLGHKKLGFGIVLPAYLVMLGILVVVFRTDAFQGKYPLFSGATQSWTLFIAFEAAYALYFVAWEFFFRGFLTLGLARTFGNWAVFIQMLPFVVMHFGKPSVEAFSSIFGGIILGWLALRTRSIWYGVLIHASIAITLDLLVGLPRLLGP